MAVHILQIARATISRHVAFDISICIRRILGWIENFECLIIAFSCELDLFFYSIQRLTKV
jgi:hypothetical protein